MPEPSVTPTDFEAPGDSTSLPGSPAWEWIDSPTTPVSLPEIQGSSDSTPTLTQQPSGQKLPATAGRNQLAGEIARGGMGAVFKGRDPELNREVAVKVLLDAHRQKPDCVRRFLEEAQIGGQLQHPGTVPVYELGRFEDGRPYFTMKLVKGHTLAKLLARRADPHDDLARFLNIFEQICQTIAYVHARGVIHRDLKPSNIMVGSFGEVQVMDWGMAKVIGRADTAATGVPAVQGESDSTIIQTIRSDSATERSRAGTMMGTPAYIPPEQARGDIAAIDEHADVFGLGAILCTILTGHPPYTGSGFLDLMEKAVNGDLAEAFARLEGSGADTELVRLCKACLAADKEQRPRDARVLAQSMAAYQEGVRQRLKMAELASATARARAEEERKRHRLTAALAAAVLGIVIVSAGSGLWLQRKEAELQRQELEQQAVLARENENRLREVEAALDKADGLRKQALWGEAGAVLEQAQVRLGEAGPEELYRRLQEAQASLKLVHRLDAIRLGRSNIGEDNRTDNRTTARDYARAFREAGLAREGETEPVVADRIRASAVHGQLVAALDDWANVEPDASLQAWVLAVARRADPNDLRNRFRDPTAWKNRAALFRLTEEVIADGTKVAGLTPPLLVAVAERLPTRDARRLLESGQRLNPNDFWINLKLADALFWLNQRVEAVEYLRAALAVRPETPVVHLNLGVSLERMRPEAAIWAYNEAIRLDPQFALAHYNLGNALRAKAGQEAAAGRAKQARTLREQAIQAYRTAVRLNPRNAGAHLNLGNHLRDLGRPEEAIAAYRLGLDHFLQNRKAPQHGPGLLPATYSAPSEAKAYNGLGLALRDLNRQEEAIQSFCRALHTYPVSVQFHANLGETLYLRGRWEESAAILNRALVLDTLPVLSLSSLGVLSAPLGQGPLVAASALFPGRAALQGKDPLSKEAPAYSAYLGRTLLALERFDEARVATQHVLQRLPANASQRRGLTAQRERSEKLLAIKDRVPALLQREVPPIDNVERLLLASYCQHDRRHYAAATRFFTDALAADPVLAEDLQRAVRYNAAGMAALAGCGKGLDAASLDAAARASLRRQALTWLRADLRLWEKQAAAPTDRTRELLRMTLRHWQDNGALAGLRDRLALQKLPAEERDECAQLWADVKALLARVSARDAR
jgi:serine/threonine-protein kinase